MGKFTLEMTREVVTIDRYTIDIEAESREDAEARAEEMACEMNGDCPDGVEQTNEMKCRSWGLRSLTSRAA